MSASASIGSTEPMLRRRARSPYEPPRAGAARFWWNTWYALRRRTWRWFPTFRTAVPPINLTQSGLLVVAVPTYGWYALGRLRLWRYALAAWLGSALAAISCIGLESAGWALGVMITLHALGIAEYFYSGKLWDRPRYWWARYPMVLAVMALVYSLAAPRAAALLVVPVQSDQGLLLINTTSRVAGLPRGETVAFRRGPWQSRNFVLHGGAYLGQIVGLPGDVVVFRPTEFVVNGQAQPRRTAMPRHGQLTVPARHRWVWPMAMRREFEREESEASFAANVALMPESHLVGRPYRYWFWRRQGP